MMNKRDPAMTEDQALRQSFIDAGIDIDAIEKEEAETNKVDSTKKVVTQMTDVLSGTNEAPAQGLTEKMGKGALVFLQDMVTTVQNGVVSLADAAENFAASKGVGRGDLISEASKWENPYKDQKLDTETEIARRVLHYATPVLGGLATSGVKAAIAAESIYSFFAIDPDEQRVADQLKGTGLDEIPVVSEIIDQLQTKADDTELDSRLKNLAEGLGIGASLAGMVYGASKVYSGVSKVRKGSMIESAAAEKAASKAPVLDETATAASDAAVSAKEITDITPGPKRPVGKGSDKVDEEIMSALGIKPTTPREEADQILKEFANLSVEEQDRVFRKEITLEEALTGDLPLFEKQWNELEWDQPPVKMTAADEPKINLSNDDIVDFFNNIAKSTDDIAKVRGPITDEETLRAVSIMKNDPEVVAKIAKWTPDQGALTDRELLVGKYISNKIEEPLTQSILKLEADVTETNAIKAMRDFENFIRAKQIENGVSSEGGRVLRANQIIGLFADRGDKEAIKQMGTIGRAKLYEGLLKKYGGLEQVQKNMGKMKLIKEMADIAKLPDNSFRARGNEVALLSAFDKTEDAVTKVALNSMLFNPKTWSRAFGGNFLMTSKNIIDNYISVGVGAARDIFQGTKSSMDLAEANARIKAALWGSVEGILPAAKSFANMKSPLYGTAKFEISSSAGMNMPNIDDVGVKQGFEWVNDGGIVVNALTAGQLPRRVLIGIDAYFSHINFKSNMAGELIQFQKAGKYTKPEEIDAFFNRAHEIEPESYINARKRAGESTFANPQEEGTLGFSVVNGIDDFMNAKGIPFARVIQPFMNTSVNIARATAEMTPIGIIDAALLKRGPTYRALKAGGREADMAMAKLASGTSAIAATMMLLDSEDLVPGYAKTREQLAMAKAFPVGKDIPEGPAFRAADGNYYSLKGLEPFSTLINAAARLKTMSGLVDEDEYGAAATTFRLLMQDAIRPEGYTEGLSILMNMVTGDEDVTKGLANIATRFVPYSGALAAAKEMTDTNRRDTTPGPELDALNEFTALVTNRIKARAPEMSGDLPITRNFFGRAVKIPDGLGPDMISPIASSGGEGLQLKRGIENLVEFADRYSGKSPLLLNFNVNMPGRVLSNPFSINSKTAPDYQMTPEEYSHFLIVRNGLDPFTGQLLEGRTTTLEQHYYDILNDFGMFDIKPKDLYNTDPKTYYEMIHRIQKVQNVYDDAAKKHMISNAYQDGLIKNKMTESVETWKNYDDEQGVGNVGQ